MPCPVSLGARHQHPPGRAPTLGRALQTAAMGSSKPAASEAGLHTKSPIAPRLMTPGTCPSTRGGSPAHRKRAADIPYAGCMPAPRKGTSSGHPLLRSWRRVRVAIIGWGMLLIGIVTTPTPLPFGIILIPAGLLVLSLEFTFAQKLLNTIETRTGAFGRRIAKLNSRARTIATRVLGHGTSLTSSGAVMPDVPDVQSHEHATHADGAGVPRGTASEEPRDASQLDPS